MAFHQVADLLRRAREFHRELRSVYERMRGQARREDVQLLLDYMQQHEAHLERCIDYYEHSAPKQVMETWFQNLPETDFVRKIQETRIDPELTADDLIQVVLDFKESLITLYQRLSEMAVPEEVEKALDLEPALFGPAHVHPRQHRGPILALGATSTGMDLKIGVIGIGLARQQCLDLALGHERAQLLKRAFGLCNAGRVIFGLAEFDQRQAIFERLLKLFIVLDLLFEHLALAHDFLSGLWIVPEVGVLRLGVQAFETGLSGIPVKDASVGLPATL